MKQSWQSQRKSRTPKQPQADDFGLRVSEFQDCEISLMKKTNETDFPMAELHEAHGTCHIFHLDYLLIVAGN